MSIKPKKEIEECICQICGRDYPVWFTDNTLWNSVCGDKIHFLCLDCFAILADKRSEKNGVWKLSIKNY